MSISRGILCSALLVSLALVFPAVSWAGAGGSIAFKIDPEQAANVVRHGANVVLQDSSGADSKPSLQITFKKGPTYPNALFTPARGPAWDWSQFGAMTFRARNTGPDPVMLFIRIDDNQNTESGTAHCKTGSATIGPGDSGTFVLTFSAGADSMTVHGMRAGPPSVVSPGAKALVGPGSVEPAHITSFQLFMHHLSADATLVCDTFRLHPTPPADHLYDAIVDEWGQYTRADWPGKIHSEAELKEAAGAEARDIQEHPALAGMDRFGGWEDGPTFATTGYFTSRKVGGKWWLVDPAGKLFLSVGPCTVAYRPWGTIVTGRESMFTWIPKEGDPLFHFLSNVPEVHSGPVSGGKLYNFYGANLQRKFGTNFDSAWQMNTVARFRSWGFNTVGNWSDETLEARHQIPYTASMGVGGNHPRVSGGWDYWNKMHDPFDPQFAEDAKASFRNLTARIKNDPWCIGYFIDNELSWGGGPGPEHGRYALAYGALAADHGSAAKGALVSQLRDEYKSAEELNKAWDEKIKSWDDLSEPFKPSHSQPTVAMVHDLAQFVTTFAKRYFTVVRDTLRESDPNHLYLGCRFAHFTPEEAKAAAEVCDVVSFNVYQPKLSAEGWGFATDLGKPCLIGEFHVGATDRGMFHPGLVVASTQQERAEIYKEFVESVVDHPAFVGCNWFEYVDEPVTGRFFDGENYNIGFVTVTDTPYPEMVAAARAVHGEMYSRRAANSPFPH